MAAQNPESEFSELFNQEEILQEQPRDVPRLDAQTTDASFNGILEMLRPSSILRSVDDVLGRESFPGGAALLGSLMPGNAGRGDASPFGSAGFQPAPTHSGNASPSESGELPLPAAKPAAGHGDSSPLIPGSAGFQPAPTGTGDASSFGSAGFQPAPTTSGNASPSESGEPISSLSNLIKPSESGSHSELPPISPVSGTIKPPTSGTNSYESGELPPAVPATLQTLVNGVANIPRTQLATSGNSETGEITAVVAPTLQGMMTNVIAPTMRSPAPSGDESPVPANVRLPAPSPSRTVENGPLAAATAGTTVGEGAASTLTNLISSSPTKEVVLPVAPGDHNASPEPSGAGWKPALPVENASPEPSGAGWKPALPVENASPEPSGAGRKPALPEDASPLPTNYVHTPIPTGAQDNSSPVPVTGVIPSVVPREIPSIIQTTMMAPTPATSAETFLSNLVTAMSAAAVTAGMREVVRDVESNMMAPTRDVVISPQRVAPTSREQTVAYTREFNSVFAKEAMGLNYSIKEVSPAPIAGKELVTAISASHDHRILLISGESITGKNISIEGIGKISLGDKSIMITSTDGGVKIPAQSNLPVGQAIIIPLDGKTRKFSDLTQSDKVPLDPSVVVTGPRINPILVNGNAQPTGPNSDPSNAASSAGITGTPAGYAPPQVHTYDDGIIINTSNGWHYIPGGELREDFTVVAPSGAVWTPNVSGVYVEVVDSFTITDEEKEQRERDREMAEAEALEDKRERELLQERRRRDEQLLVAELGTKRRQPLVNDEPRKRYYVKIGDTLESIATKELKNRQLAYLIYQINKMWIGIKVKNGKRIPQLKVGMVLYLPSRSDTEFYRNNMRHAKRAAVEIAMATQS